MVNVIGLLKLLMVFCFDRNIRNIIIATILYHFSPLKLLAIAKAHFAFIVVMLKRFKLLYGCLQSRFISKESNCYREDD